ncbi:MAG: thioredoxin-disulfide reductase [Chloroflexi bacterium]|jgi:thioredoxin reductase (NADPH)|nr:thioredoxin-disulfide reductase [Chloroflexota bacterium]
MSDISLSLDFSRLTQTEEEGAEEIQERDLIIIGAGPAGLTAGLYAGRAQLRPLILVGQSFGGQAATTSEMENYPGFPEGIGGLALAEQMASHAKRFEAEIAYEEVTSVDLSTYPFVINTYGGVYHAKTLIICTGTSARRLGVPGESKFIGRGVSFCATCDGYFYKDKTVVVVGGGDSALDEGLYLTRFAREVIIIHRRDRLRANPTLQRRARANPKVRFVFNSVVEEVMGEQTVKAVRVRNVNTNEESLIETEGVFVYIGLIPNTTLFKDQLELTTDGYIVTDKRQRTSVPGVYAAGDVQDPWFRQVVVAAGAGAAAAIEAERFLAEKAFEDQAEEDEETKGE